MSDLSSGSHIRFTGGGEAGPVMRYALTALACALVAVLPVVMIGSTPRAPDPPPVQLVDDARSTQPAQPVRARSAALDGRDRARDAGRVPTPAAEGDDGAGGDRATAPPSPPAD